jgi:polyribonucleotide nucleotidyltransferase
VNFAMLIAADNIQDMDMDMDIDMDKETDMVTDSGMDMNIGNLNRNYLYKKLRALKVFKL